MAQATPAAGGIQGLPPPRLVALPLGLIHLLKGLLQQQRPARTHTRACAMYAGACAHTSAAAPATMAHVCRVRACLCVLSALRLLQHKRPAAACRHVHGCCGCVHALSALRVHALSALRVHALSALCVHALSALCVHALSALRVHALSALCVHALSTLRVQSAATSTCIQTWACTQTQDGTHKMCADQSQGPLQPGHVWKHMHEEHAHACTYLGLLKTAWKPRKILANWHTN